MKYIILSTITLLFSILQTNAQVKKEIDNGIYVTFPSQPEYKFASSASSYVTKSTNCLFIVIIQRNALPNYLEYFVAKQQWTKTEIAKVENEFLDNAVKGKLGYTGNTGTVTPIKIGEFNGRNISYSAINPVTGERGKRFTRMFLVRDKAITFEVMFLKDSDTASQEKDKFFNSIQTQ